MVEPTINTARFLADLEALALIGATDDGGVHRPALSEAHLEARRWFRGRAAAAGLEVRVDGAGNHSARLTRTSSARTLLLGSHLDSVPHGGRFDGALGVVAALEAVRMAQELGLAPAVNLEAIDFTDEEGTLVDFLGSRALAGQLTTQDLVSPAGGRAALEAGLAHAGLAEEEILGARRDAAALAGYLELHIEQGPRLEALHVPIGVVTGIVGIRSWRLKFLGQANHAGTTPMGMRRDAGLGASGFLLGAHEVVRAFPDCVCNVGAMQFAPGAFNVVPGLVDVSLECRAPEPGQLEQLSAALLARAEAEARPYKLAVTATPLARTAPAPTDPVLRAALASSAESLGLRWLAMPSGAGHDAQVLAPLTRIGMVFVPSAGGISHSPLEFTSAEDCVNGANVLLRAAVRLASGDLPLPEDDGFQSS